MFSKRVFISHSSKDKPVAIVLDAFLKSRGVEIFLDVDQIQVGENLPQSIESGISGCDYFLLLWSDESRNSNWVKAEITTATKLNKQIVPYRLDQTELPGSIGNILTVTVEDAKLGHPDLCNALGIPPGPFFPGKWKVTTVIPGPIGVSGTYWLEVKRSGHIIGEGKVNFGGFGTMLDDSMMAFANLKISLSGTWMLDVNTMMITLNINASGFNISTQDKVMIFLTDSKNLKGQDTGGREWFFERLDTK